MDKNKNIIKNHKFLEFMGRTRKAPLLRLAAYYLLLGIILLLIRQLASEYYNNLDSETLERFSDILLEGMNLMTHRDDVMISTFHIMASFVYILPVAWVYVITKEGKGIDQSIVQTIILISIVVTGIMIMLEDNLARAFGMVAILTAVRYRVAVKDSKDAVYIFLSMAIGMANGLGVPHMALSLSILVNICLIILWKFKVGDVVTNVSDSDKNGENNNELIIEPDTQKHLKIEIPPADKQIIKDLRKNGYSHLIRIGSSDPGKFTKNFDSFLSNSGFIFSISNISIENGISLISYGIKLPNSDGLNKLNSGIYEMDLTDIKVEISRIDYK